MNRIDIAEAAARLKTARRVMVLGCSGSGKSTLSRKLSERFGLPHISMDRDVFWLPGWVIRDKAEIRALVERFSQGETWIFDGNNTETMPPRMARADLILWLVPPRRVSLWGALKRIPTSYGRVRPDMAPGCPERIDLDFLRYIWNFNRRTLPKMERMVEENGADLPVCLLKSHRAVNELLALCAEEH
ncbi:ATPase AAA [Martelella endophytica]|uniref:ATPase AAA n=1 Tax=Martelella endophytica TaxID=1486262 RepID=A0A0D5LS83_MAREN|nr:ATPase AAA [Martelella endophytica]AJY46931.1 ATPase AAA [Martelella endophytica]